MKTAYDIVHTLFPAYFHMFSKIVYKTSYSLCEKQVNFTLSFAIQNA